jgi:hypothetical protein
MLERVERQQNSGWSQIYDLNGTMALTHHRFAVYLQLLEEQQYAIKKAWEDHFQQ